MPSLARAREHPLLAATAAALLLALISAAWPTIPSYDPFSWVVWGREVTDPHISFYIGGGPSWKPLPFLFTAVYGAFGGLAPTFWVLTSRIGGLLGLFGAYRLASMLAQRVGSRRLAPVAGLAALLAVGLTVDWSYYFFRGSSEPILIGVALWAIERLLRGRHGQAYFLACVEGLMRPEAWPFIFVLGLWLWRYRPALRAWVLIGLIAQPVGWFLPPWISTGDPLLAASHASSYNGHLGGNPFLTVMGRGATLQPPVTLALALIATALAWVRRREPLILALAAGTAAWWVVVVGMTLVGYPGLQRFFLPAAAVTCVLAGVGIVWLGELVGELTSGAQARVAAAVAGLLLLGSVATLGDRISFARAQEPLAARAVHRIDALGRAIALLGGRHRMLPCHSSVVTINHSLQTAMAFKLGTSLERVQTSLRHPGLAFVGPKDSVDGGPPAISHRLSRHVFLRRVGPWRIYAVYAPGPRPHCVGG